MYPLTTTWFVWLLSKLLHVVFWFKRKWGTPIPYDFTSTIESSACKCNDSMFLTAATKEGTILSLRVAREGPYGQASSLSLHVRSPRGVLNQSVRLNRPMFHEKNTVLVDNTRFTFEEGTICIKNALVDVVFTPTTPSFRYQQDEDPKTIAGLLCHEPWSWSFLKRLYAQSKRRMKAHYHVERFGILAGCAAVAGQLHVWEDMAGFVDRSCDVRSWNMLESLLAYFIKFDTVFCTTFGKFTHLNLIIVSMPENVLTYYTTGWLANARTGAKVPITSMTKLNNIAFENKSVSEIQTFDVLVGDEVFSGRVFRTCEGIKYELGEEKFVCCDDPVRMQVDTAVGYGVRQIGFRTGKCNRVDEIG